MAPIGPSPAESIVAVTGATGFIGSHVVDQLLKAGYKVRAVVRKPDDEAKVAHLKTLENAALRLTLWRGDLGDEGSYDDAFNGADAVVHTAAVVSWDADDPVADIVNPTVNGVKNVLASAEKAASVKRFVHTSSELACMKWDEPLDSIFNEDSWNTVSTVNNGDPYGYAKVLAERLVLDFKSSHFDVVSINPGVNLGPCMTKSHTDASPAIVKALVLGEEQPAYNAQFVDVRDSAVAHVRALTVALPQGDSRRFLVVFDTVHVAALEETLQRLFPDYVFDGIWFPNACVTCLLHTPLVNGALADEFERTMGEQEFQMDNSKSKAGLGLVYHSLDDTLKDTVTSMVTLGVVEPRNEA